MSSPAASRLPDRHPVTPDGRYFVLRGRLWRTSNPALGADERQRLVSALMTARRDVGAAMRCGQRDAVREARRRVNEAKVALGERGPVWWSDGAPDLNRRMAANTPYAEWFECLSDREHHAPTPDGDRCTARITGPGVRY